MAGGKVLLQCTDWLTADKKYRLCVYQMPFMEGEHQFEGRGFLALICESHFFCCWPFALALAFFFPFPFFASWCVPRVCIVAGATRHHSR